MAETNLEIKQRIRESQRNYIENLRMIEDILENERRYVSQVHVSEDAVVLCSGGLDSTVMINKVIEDWDVRVYPIFIRRGARAEKHEEKAFDYFMKFYKKRFPDNIGEAFKLNYEIPPRQLKDQFPKELGLTVGHPLRNSTLQNLAVMYAVSLKGKPSINGNYNLDIKTIFSGSIGDDNTEPELGILSLRAQTLSTCIQLGDWSWQITSPFTDPYLTRQTMFKQDLIEYALQKFIPLEKTRTCFSQESIADGTCFACQKRLKAFENAGIKDPLKYKKHE